MAGRQKREERPLPPPLPPAQRTVGQLVGEAIRAYGAHFWRGLALGTPVVAANALVWQRSSDDFRLVGLPLTAFLISISYVMAIGLVNGVPVATRRGVLAYLVAVAIFVPVPLLVAIFILPGLVWLSLFGLAIPAILVEGLPVRAAFRRGLALLLESQADNTVRVAVFLADAVLGPLLFLGGAILYVDQEARLRSRKRGKERRADLPDADDPHREGGPDPAREPGPAA